MSPAELGTDPPHDPRHASIPAPGVGMAMVTRDATLESKRLVLSTTNQIR